MQETDLQQAYNRAEDFLQCIDKKLDVFGIPTGFDKGLEF